MGLKNMSLVTGATVGFTGGDALTFADDGMSIQNGVHLVVPNDEYIIRRQITAKVRAATLVPSTGALGKDKKSLTYVVPVQDAGRIIFATLRIEREVYPTMSAVACEEMNLVGAQLLTSAATAAFWATGSTN